MTAAIQQRPKLILLDLDGTLYIGDQAIAGAIDCVRQLRQQGLLLRFLTNTTTKSKQQLVAQLQAMGFELSTDELISAPVAAALELQRLQHVASKPISIWPLVADAIKPDFSAFTWDENRPDFIVLGDIGDRWDLSLINRLFNAMHNGAELIALHKNRFWQTTEGLKADIGFFVAGLEYVCSKTARVMGKPNRDFFQLVLDSVNTIAADTLMVGDDIDSDIGGALEMGMRGCLVKTGKFRQAYFEQSTVKPDMVLESVRDLYRAL